MLGLVVKLEQSHTELNSVSYCDVTRQYVITCNIVTSSFQKTSDNNTASKGSLGEPGNYCFWAFTTALILSRREQLNRQQEH